MNGIPELRLMPKETSEEYKVRCLEFFIGEIRNSFPSMKKHNFKVVYSNSKITETDLESFGSLVCISDNGVSYWFRPYSEPGAPSIGSYPLNDIYDFINNPIRDLIVNDCAPYDLPKEKKLDSNYKAIADKLLGLQQEEKVHMLKDMRAVLEGAENHYELYLALLEKDVDLIKLYRDDGTAEKTGIKNTELEEFITLILHGEKDAIKSKGQGFVFKLLLSASTVARENFKFDWHSKEHKDSSDKLNSYISEITPIAREYFENLLVKFGESNSTREVNHIVFN